MSLCRFVVTVSVTLLAASAAWAEDSGIQFRRTQLDAKFRSEGTAVGDFNGDGRLDISAGSVYYAAPDWTMVTVAEEAKEYDPLGYSNSFGNFAEDVNRDGRADLVVVDFPGQQTWWFEQPAAPAEPWTRHVGIYETNNESPMLVDADGDGRRELLCATGERMILARPAADPNTTWVVQNISGPAGDRTGRYYHGLGLGDIDRDGRSDVVVPHGWWEAPAPGAQHEWVWHPAPFGEAAGQMHVYDYDGDGDQDVLSSSAHAYGIWWHEQTAAGWQTHEIDTSFSQTHAMCLADINADGLPDFVTGKRWWAHGPNGDPGRDEPAVLFWFELRREAGRPVWIPHEIDHDSGMGTQFEVADVNADGLLDVVTSNKKGVFYFEQARGPASAADEPVATITAEEEAEGFVPLFDGQSLSGWIGAVEGYAVENGAIVCVPEKGGNLYTEREYADFVFRFQFKLTPGANNGLGLRAPTEGDAAYVGMELQILDDSAEQYANLHEYQYHGSIYGVVACERGHQRAVGEWNEQEVTCQGRRVKVVLNGATIIDADIDEASKDGTIDGNQHPGLARTSGHIGFLGHGSRVEFRNIRLKDLAPAE
jgi:hypothetical protein